MSFQERRSIFNLSSSIVITVLYSAYMIQRYPQADAYSPDIFHYWGSFFLLLIIFTIVAKIISYIVFSILNAIATREQEPSITDERDRLIELKSMRNGFFVFILGFVLAMVTVAAGQPPAVMFVTLLCGGVASEIVSDFSEFHYYRRGI